MEQVLISKTEILPKIEILRAYFSEPGISLIKSTRVVTKKAIVLSKQSCILITDGIVKCMLELITCVHISYK